MTRLPIGRGELLRILISPHEFAPFNEGRPEREGESQLQAIKLKYSKHYELHAPSATWGKESGGGQTSSLSAIAGEGNSLARSPLLPHEWESPRTGPGGGRVASWPKLSRPSGNAALETSQSGGLFSGKKGEDSHLDLERCPSRLPSRGGMGAVIKHRLPLERKKNTPQKASLAVALVATTIRMRRARSSGCCQRLKPGGASGWSQAAEEEPRSSSCGSSEANARTLPGTGRSPPGKAKPETAKVARGTSPSLRALTWRQQQSPESCRHGEEPHPPEAVGDGGGGGGGGSGRAGSGRGRHAVSATARAGRRSGSGAPRLGRSGAAAAAAERSSEGSKRRPSPHRQPGPGSFLSRLSSLQRRRRLKRLKVPRKTPRQEKES